MKRGPRQERRERMRRLLAREIAATEGVSLEYLAGRIGISRASLQRKLDERDTAQVGLADLDILADDLPGLLHALGLARRAPAQAKSPHDAFAAAVRECGDVAARVAEALRDGRVLPAEAEAIRREIAEARRALDVLEASVGGGNPIPFASRR